MLGHHVIFTCDTCNAPTLPAYVRQEDGRSFPVLRDTNDRAVIRFLTKGKTLTFCDKGCAEVYDKHNNNFYDKERTDRKTE